MQTIDVVFIFICCFSLFRFFRFREFTNVHSSFDWTNNERTTFVKKKNETQTYFRFTKLYMNALAFRTHTPDNWTKNEICYGRRKKKHLFYTYTCMRMKKEDPFVLHILDRTYMNSRKSLDLQVCFFSVSVYVGWSLPLHRFIR